MEGLSPPPSSSDHGPQPERDARHTHLEKRRVHVGHHVGQPPPLADGQTAGHFHQALDEAELLLLGVADGQVAAVHVDFPRHLFGTTYFHLVVKEHYTGSNGQTPLSTKGQKCKQFFCGQSCKVINGNFI